ncbi:hypothetical protein YC2023_055971 [Brassica napus]
MRSIILILAVMSLGLGSPTKTSDQKDIECIYIYKQLAFSHELLQNHKLQVFFLINPSTPSEVPKSVQVEKKSKWKTSETQVSKANCPEGMIPMDQSSRHEEVIESFEALESAKGIGVEVVSFFISNKATLDVLMFFDE